MTVISFSDMAKLKGRDNTTGMNGNKWIIFNKKKTDIRSAIPLLPQVIEVVEKYNPEYSSNLNAQLLPKYSNQKFNSLLQ
jgi:hypothetical protein